MKYPFLIPNSPKLSESRDLLTEIELSGLFTNYGPKNSQLEAEFASLFESPGQTCLTVCNATLGLIVAIRLLLEQSKRQGSLCLMPSFTFAATAHAASWNGLNPLFCDVDPKDWTMDKQQIKSLLKKHGDEVALIMPYATFGTNLDLSWYEQLSEKTGVPVLIDDQDLAPRVQHDPSGATADLHSRPPACGSPTKKTGETTRKSSWKKL